jgi:hypothetical protein
LFERLKIELGP